MPLLLCTLLFFCTFIVFCSFVWLFILCWSFYFLPVLRINVLINFSLEWFMKLVYTVYTIHMLQARQMQSIWADSIRSIWFIVYLMACYWSGQHEIVSLINNFFSREDLEYYCQPRGIAHVLCVVSTISFLTLWCELFRTRDRTQVTTRTGTLTL
jgi:hypothetical protein